jgi:hypothetical protein
VTSPYPENMLEGILFATMEDIKSNSTIELRNIPKKPTAGASNNGRIDVASVYA